MADNGEVSLILGMTITRDHDKETLPQSRVTVRHSPVVAISCDGHAKDETDLAHTRHCEVIREGLLQSLPYVVVLSADQDVGV